jgi:Protein of unknown function (DUF3570)
MQLKRRGPGAPDGLRRTLAAAATGLLASVQGHAQQPPAGFEDDIPTTHIDAGLLYYHENGRVQAIEPDLDLTQQIGENSVLSLGLTVDSVTGPTPLGAVPSTLAQSYVRPYKVIPLGTPVTVTTASGGSVVTLIPPASGATTQTLSATTTVPPNTYPLDRAFSDRRIAGHAGWQQALTSTLRIDGGFAYSKEHDYRSESADLGLSKDFNSHNTTLSAGINYESDLSFPLGGTPTPLAQMTGDWKGPDASRHELDAVVGLTQVMTRRWLTSLSYSYASARGYQNDPYKLISVVDPSSGQPTSQLYESRPERRRKQSLFWDNKIHLRRDIVDVSLRGYEDDWGIKSVTADLRYRFQMGQGYYLEPHVRYYHQGAANFFHYYLVGSDPLPEYASADTRLAAFQAHTFGLKFGLPLNEGSEFNIRLEYYGQHGNGSPSYAIGQLRQQNLFPNLTAVTVLFGYSYAF